MTTTENTFDQELEAHFEQQRARNLALFNLVGGLTNWRPNQKASRRAEVLSGHNKIMGLVLRFVP